MLLFCSSYYTKRAEACKHYCYEECLFDFLHTLVMVFQSLYRVLKITNTELDRNEEIVCWQLVFWWLECDDGLGYIYRGVIVACLLYTA
jgi:hypothetical protein